MEAFYKRHGFPSTKASKVVQGPDKSQKPEIGAVVPVEGGGASALNKSYALSDSEDEEEEGGAGAAAGAAEPVAEQAAADAAAAADPAAAANAGPA